jgi:hypothetical protein
MTEDEHSLAKLGVFIALGALGGFAYYTFIGCTSGTCPITSNLTSARATARSCGATLGWERKKNSSHS